MHPYRPSRSLMGPRIFLPGGFHTGSSSRNALPPSFEFANSYLGSWLKCPFFSKVFPNAPSCSIWYFPFVTETYLLLYACPSLKTGSSLRAGTMSVLWREAEGCLAQCQARCSCLVDSGCISRRIHSFIPLTAVEILLCAGVRDSSAHRPLRGCSWRKPPLLAE